ncbi:MAG: VanW family protein [Clostridia bacterium]|nr:VanW family protein [Clostridia bacterium]
MNNTKGKLDTSAQDDAYENDVYEDDVYENNVYEETSSEEATTENKSDSKKLLKIFVPAAAVILTAGVIISAASLNFFSAETHEAFISTEQSGAELAAPQGIFISGISVADIDLGGLTMKEAKDKLMKKESDMIPSINYTLTCGERVVYLTEDDFGYTFDTVKVLNEAYEYSEYMRDLLMTEGRAHLRASEQKNYPITMTFDDSSVKTICDEVAKKVDIPVQQAHVESIDVTRKKIADMFTFADGVTGAKLDVDDLLTQLNTLIKSERYTADVIGQMTITKPEVDLENLKKNLVMISHYITYSGNTWAGNMNMTTAMKSMNGTIIRPGEVFSFNEKTGDSNQAENGYYSAGVIVGGRSADGIGGGICQAATTIYNAAIRADMTVVEREPHTWPSVYVPIGIDSAIDYGLIDMKFRNDTEHEVYLICYMDGGTLHAYIFGYKPDSYDEICTNSWYTGGGGVGFGAEAQRNYYKNGKIVKTLDLPSSFYANGGGTSYSFEEEPSGYVFKRVYTDAQAKDGVLSYPEICKDKETSDIPEPFGEDENKDSDNDDLF